MNISSIDLNLLVVLHAVLVEQSVTRAAKRLHVTQSAVSNSLGRLRDVFGDPLVVRNARGVTPTPRAIELLPALSAVIERVTSLVEPRGTFDPATTTRSFTISCADFYGSVILPPMMDLLSHRAPNATLKFVSLERMVADNRLAVDVDLHIGMPPTIDAACHCEPLFTDSLVTISRRLKRARTGRMPLREYVERSHLRVLVLDKRRDIIDDAFDARGLLRKVALDVPHFSVVPLVVQRTDHVATISKRLALTYADFVAIDVLTPPIALPKLGIKMTWHERTEREPACRFLRSIVRESLATSGATRRSRRG